MTRRHTPGTLFVLILGATAAAAEQPLPRYSLTTGRVLEYTATSSSKDKKTGENGGESTATFRFMILRQNPDGSRRVLVRSTSKYRPGGHGGDVPEDVRIGYFELFPDGHVVTNVTTGPQLDPRQMFPLLPKDAQQAQGTWSDHKDAGDETITFTAEPQTAGEYVFKGTETGAMSRIYEMTRNQTVHFDPPKGVVTRIDGTYTQDYGFHTTGTGETTLTSDTTLDPSKLAALAADYDAYFDVLANNRALYRRAAEDPRATDKAMDTARTNLANAVNAIHTDEVRAEIDRSIKQHDESVKYELDDAKSQAAVLGHPAKGWTTTDIDGKPWSAQSLKGKVVVMDFWYRGCGWCMYAMPQVQQIADEYKDRGGVVLGMNTDREDADARVVVKEMGLTYPILKADDIAKAYDIHGFPTLLIVDQAGVVRAIDVGYSPDLRDKVARKLDELLKARDAAPAG